MKWARAPWRRRHFCACSGPSHIECGYAQPSRRPADGRYGENPNRLFKHTQFQLILKPPPVNVQELYLESLEAIGIDLSKHDLKFEEDNWEWPAGGAWGVGWQVMLDGLEITQFTYFQQCGGLDLDPICAELTYGLERIAHSCRMWTRSTTSCGRAIRRPARRSPTATSGWPRSCSSRCTTSSMPTCDKLWEHFNLYEAEAQSLLAQAQCTACRAKTRERGGEAALSAAGDL